MPCPNGAYLARDMAAYQKAGVGRIVSMLATDEAETLGLAGEADACSNAGMLFDQHPIQDFGLPDLNQFQALVDDIKGWIQGGQGVAVHCRAGIGRSGMVASGVLVALGRSAEQAIKDVSHARGVSIPDTVEQGRFIAAFAHNLG